MPGVVVLQPPRFEDSRGALVKPFHAPTFERLGLRTDFREQYYSSSRRGVVRGMHFQSPPSEHAKLVYCIKGRVLDVVLDLRAGPTLGTHDALVLSEENGHAVYIPPGVAHGFCATSTEAVLVYNVTSVHDPDHDDGVRWDSFGVRWPVEDPVVSERDAGFVPLSNFDTPFRS